MQFANSKLIIKDHTEWFPNTSFWTQLSDSPVDKAAWATYRQALRDITTQVDPFNIKWPKINA